MDDAVDRDPARGDRGGNRIDQERHVVVDDRQPDAPSAVGFGRRFERDAGLAGGALAGGVGDEARGFGKFGLAEAVEFAGQRALGQPHGKRVGQ